MLLLRPFSSLVYTIYINKLTFGNHIIAHFPIIYMTYTQFNSNIGAGSAIVLYLASRVTHNTVFPKLQKILLG